MSDLFHDDVPDRFIFDILWTMRTLPRHTFQILTKRPERMRSLVRRKFRTNEPPQNVWFGVSVENQSAADERIPLLLDTRDAVRWLSCEPLLDPVDLGPYLDDLDWVVVGGESGPGARPMDLDWAREIRDQCIGAGVPFFFKQVGGRRKINGHFGGNLIDGRTWQEFPR
jgi:protein gp37